MLIEPTEKNIKSALMRYAPRITWDETKRKKVLAVAKCQGCGEEIRSDKDLSGTGYVVTKRGTCTFFHNGCFGRIWERKITTC